jgi:RNA polymerase sigma factor (sigma-70 family)
MMRLRRGRAIPTASSAVSADVHRMGLPADRLPDETLLAGLAAGDPAATVAFVRRFQGTVFGVAAAVLGDPRLAEDVAQQTFERAWRHARVYDPRRGSVRVWVTTIARNLAIDTARARRPTPVDPAEVAALLGMVTDGPEQRALDREESAEVRIAIRSLPVEQARALVMASVYGMTARQISELEGIPLGTAKTRIRTAMEKLRVILTSQRADHD